MSPSVAIVSATLTVVTMVFAIFGASRLNQRSVGKLLEQMEKRFDARFDALAASVGSLGQRLDQRLNSVEQRFDRIERQLEAVFKRVLPPRA